MISPDIIFLGALVLGGVAVMVVLRKQTAILDAGDIADMKKRIADLERSNQLLNEMLGRQAARIDELERMLKERSDEVFVLRSRLRQSGLDWGIEREDGK